MSTVYGRFKIDDVLTDVTTATVGVTRTDTGADVVTAGTAMTHDGTGLYSHAFTDPAYGLTYTATMTFVYNGATYSAQKTITGPVAATPAGTWADICDEIEAITGQTSVGDALLWATRGYEWFISGVANPFSEDSRDLIPHVWSFMEPEAQLTIGSTVTLAGYCVDGLVTLTTGAVDSSCPGSQITVGDDSYGITTYYSPTSFYCSGAEDFGSVGSPSTITLPAAGEYDLPSTFGGLIEPFHYPDNEASINPEIALKPMSFIYAFWRDNATAYVPRYYALVAKAFVAATGTRYRAAFAPIPDEERTLLYRFRVEPDAPADSALLYPLGGRPHQRTIINCALGIRELESGKFVNGPLMSLAIGSMRSSIARDNLLIGSVGPQTIASRG